MRTLVWGGTFLRSLKRLLKRHPDVRSTIDETLRLLAADPFTPQLATHKLKGKLAGTWACSAGYDLRIIFEFVRSNSGEETIFLIEIGTHEEVY